MSYYEVEPFWGIKFLLFLAIVVLILFSFNEMMSRILKVKRKSLFLIHYVNDQHKKIDWIIKGIFIVVMLLVGVIVINISKHPMDPTLFLVPHFLVFAVIFLNEIVTAVMEWKYEENRNAYILTIIQLIFMTILLIVIFTTNFFGLFE